MIPISPGWNVIAGRIMGEVRSNWVTFDPMELTDSMSGAIMDDWGYFIFNVHLIFLIMKKIWMTVLNVCFKNMIWHVYFQYGRKFQILQLQIRRKNFYELNLWS